LKWLIIISFQLRRELLHKYGPYKSVTGFSEALSCVDDLMLAKGVRDIPVMVEDISDKTESVPVRNQPIP